MKFTLVHKASVGDEINRRASGFYHVMFEDSEGKYLGHLIIQGNPFGSCGINLLAGWGRLWPTPPVECIPDLFEFLKNFADMTSHGVTTGVGLYKAKRYLIQITRAQCHDIFLKEILKHCILLSEYENHAHPSSTQYLYMLELK